MPEGCALFSNDFFSIISYIWDPFWGTKCVGPEATAPLKYPLYRTPVPYPQHTHNVQDQNDKLRHLICPIELSRWKAVVKIARYVLMVTVQMSQVFKLLKCITIFHVNHSE